MSGVGGGLEKSEVKEIQAGVIKQLDTKEKIAKFYDGKLYFAVDASEYMDSHVSVT